MKNAYMLVILSALVFVSGCFGPRFYFEIREITIETIPSGAKVRQINSVDEGEIFLGTTPIRNQPVRILSQVKGKVSSMTADWMASQILMLNVRIEKPGFETYEGNLATDPMKPTEHRIKLDPKYP